MHSHGYKKILVVCGAGIATSTIVVNKVRNELASRGFRNIYIKQVSIAELAGVIGGYDLLIQITGDPANVNIPVVSGVPFLTGRGKEDLLEEIIKLLDLNA
jgi:PTS system galactitol-specific IIB component